MMIMRHYEKFASIIWRIQRIYPEKIEKKSEMFLKRIIGEEKFDKLKKDGKIDIHAENVRFVLETDL